MLAGIAHHTVLEPWSTVVHCVSDGENAYSVMSCVAQSSQVLTFSLMLIMTVFCFLASVVTNNDSWVDRLWSIAPVVYAWTFAMFNVQLTGEALLWSSPSLVFTTLITLWGIRLTYNFYRKGGYQNGGEDYRWLYVRSWPLFQQAPRVVWYTFSFFVVSLFQSWLLWAITLPLGHLPTNSPVSLSSQTFAAILIFFIALETHADQHQWQFQNEKRGIKHKQPGVNYKIGFCIDGTFAYSRHMNVFSEQCIWITVFLAGAVNCGGINHPSIIGCVTLVALTIGSTWLTESISSAKYPLYRTYQKTTPMLIPSLRSTEDLTKYLIEKSVDIADGTSEGHN
mmetsp:Transcript_29716/g.34323  ORF Transcript_29716/g.34323 Transcript_29716/m.34323 type:complete len:338 (+) Transcript_29716:71-1084(+)